MQCRHNQELGHLSLIVAAILSLGSASVLAEEIGQDKSDENKVAAEESSGFSDIGGSLTAGYTTNTFNDYRRDRSLSWNLGLNTTYKKDYKLYASTGGYRSFDSNRGDFNTDTLVGLKYNSLLEFGEEGKVAVRGQFTIPTSEASRDDKLTTAFRLDLPVNFKLIGLDWSISPRVKKNFHRYKTQGGRSLTEWVYQLYSSVGYAWDDFYISASLLGGNTVSYQGTRRNSFDYSGSLSVSYDFTDEISASLSASNAGYYADTERGSLGDIDLFNEADSSYSFDVTYSF